jgi:hypothetical protein
MNQLDQSAIAKSFSRCTLCHWHAQISAQDNRVRRIVVNTKTKCKEMRDKAYLRLCRDLWPVIRGEDWRPWEFGTHTLPNPLKSP